jgi:signal transduction histidine kinase
MEQAYRTEAKAKECLAKLMEMKSSFVAVASHELKTPVAVIRLYAEMLREGVLRPSEPGYAEALNAMIAASGRLVSIISDLMDASLWERGEIAIKRETVDISELVAEAVHDAEALCSGHQTRVVLQEPVPEIVGEVDPLRLRQVLDNMISNAVKYSDGAPEALVSLRQERHKAIIEVTDFGRGIPEGASGTVFGLFGRVAGESDAVSGLGLGMAISQRIALAHGGTLSFRANPAGKGTVFSLALPLGLGATERPSSHERARVV